MGYPISCIQHPETGRELRLRHARADARPAKRILVAGGGPGRHEGRGRAGRTRPRASRSTRPPGGSAARRCWRSCCRVARSSAASSPTWRARCELAGVAGRAQHRGVDPPSCGSRSPTPSSSPPAPRPTGRRSRAATRCMSSMPGRCSRGEANVGRSRRRRRLALRLDRPRPRREAGARRLPRAPRASNGLHRRPATCPGTCATSWAACCTSSASRSFPMRACSVPTPTRVPPAYHQWRTDRRERREYARA